ncbi:MAG TPA: tail fiber domain-containing protein, partial [Tenuifilaceae bacterium]|nr:tail fiber domain-containing protein [Tenuifilaceae bacterium]
FDNDRVAINTVSPTQTLDVNGNARFRSVGSGAYNNPLNITSDGTLTTATSDVRLKEEISTLENALTKVMQLRGVSFKWKKEPSMGKRIGFIAQEIEQVFPELVFTNETDGYKGVNYAEMTAVLVEAMKEQQTIIDKQQKELDLLKAELEAIKKLLSK